MHTCNPTKPFQYASDRFRSPLIATTSTEDRVCLAIDSIEENCRMSLNRGMTEDDTYLTRTKIIFTALYHFGITREDVDDYDSTWLLLQDSGSNQSDTTGCANKKPCKRKHVPSIIPDTVADKITNIDTIMGNSDDPFSRRQRMTM